jgi:hypothetical protein
MILDPRRRVARGMANGDAKDGKKGESQQGDTQGMLRKRRFCAAPVTLRSGALRNTYSTAEFVKGAPPGEVFSSVSLVYSR